MIAPVLLGACALAVVALQQVCGCKAWDRPAVKKLTCFKSHVYSWVFVERLLVLFGHGFYLSLCSGLHLGPKPSLLSFSPGLVPTLIPQSLHCTMHSRVLMLHNPASAVMCRDLWHWRNRQNKMVLLQHEYSCEPPLSALLDGVQIGNGALRHNSHKAWRLSCYHTQKQSLNFMLNCERQPDGYKSWFWVPIENSTGDRFWYSPVFNMMVDSLPDQPTGGFLGGVKDSG